MEVGKRATWFRGDFAFIIFREEQGWDEIGGLLENGAKRTLFRFRDTGNIEPRDDATTLRDVGEDEVSCDGRNESWVCTNVVTGAGTRR